MIARLSRTAMVAALVAGVMTLPAASTSADPVPEADEPLRQLDVEVLHTLGHGSPDERLEAAEQIDATLSLGFSGRRDPSRPLDELIDGLILVLDQETDDWIARTLLDSLMWDGNPSMNRLFREALRSDSVNVKAMGIERFTYQDDFEAIEALESLWELDLPAWLRPHLIRALAEQGSTAQIEDFMRLTRDEESETREAAIEALGTLRRPEAIPALAYAARHGTAVDRAAAIEALGAFPDSAEALEEALRASRSGERSILSAAIAALGRLGRPDGDDRLIALLDEPPDPDLRAALAEALEDSSHPDATPALVRLLHESDVGPDSWIASTVLRVLHNRDDAGAVPGLLDLPPAPGKRAGDEMAALIEYLSRDRSDGERSLIATTHCSFGVRVSPTDPRSWSVVPSPPFETIRCWDAPDRVGDPESQPRIPAGTPELISDHFETPARPWVEIRGSGADGCWVPLDQLEKGAGASDEVAWPRRWVRHEFDIRTRELESRPARLLSEAGLLEIFEPGDQVAGVALKVDALNADQVGLVRALSSGAGPELGAALRTVLREVDPNASEIVVDDADEDTPTEEDFSDEEDE